MYISQWYETINLKNKKRYVILIVNQWMQSIQWILIPPDCLISGRVLSVKAAKHRFTAWPWQIKHSQISIRQAELEIKVFLIRNASALDFSIQVPALEYHLNVSDNVSFERVNHCRNRTLRSHKIVPGHCDGCVQPFHCVLVFLVVWAGAWYPVHYREHPLDECALYF